ncbi:protein HESO1 [Camellia sinensis]|uniref:protein HESO1 n=1 Tax=Camellia sinensis TaxID=4442 RepID=UPI001035B40B|nr:protein HESO1 [Camellia sinensis]XP_028065380.1 protein HESO1 [Camellia sinensis]
MNDYSTLELTLRDILRVISPLEEDWAKRFQFINELRAVVESVESLRGATVEPYGSFVSNLFTRWGDLDLSIELPNGSFISSAGKKLKQTLLGDLQKALRRRGGWYKLQFIANARVPILKFESNYLNISCDVSINSLNGQMKSKLLFWINEIDGRFRNMVLLVKEWAKTHGINDSKSGTLNSYCLSMLIIFHFQTCVPPLLPPLKEIYPGNIVDDLIGVRAVAERHIEEICAENINKFRSDKSRKINRSSLSELFISFLKKFADISSRASEKGICPYTGQWEQIDANMRWLPKTYALFVEDPFEQPVNTARTVSIRHLTRISEAFQGTHYALTSRNQSHSSLIPTLVRPHVSQSIWRTPNNASGYNASYSRPRPQMHRAVHSPSQVLHQFQNMRIDRRPSNVTTQRMVSNASNSQGQRAWRPRSDW